MILFIIQSLYFFLPAYIANMVPVICGKSDVSGMFSQPIDAHHSFRGVRIFGDNKTWGGLVGGILSGTLVFLVQQKLYLFVFFQNLSLLDYSMHPITLGFLMALGALGGDLGKSFVKRRLGKAPGTSWFPFDQIDYVFGAFIFVLPFYVPDASVFIVVLVLAPLFHYAANYLAYVFGLKKVWW